MTRLLVLLGIVAIPTNHGLERYVTEGDLVRAFAFGRCLATAYPTEPFVADATWSAGMYREMGKGLKFYTEAVSMIPKDLETPTVYEHHKIAVFKCLEFYESRELKALAKKAR
ncbi:MAG TPA: T6SS amidase immunity protein Tai4 family protein [Polyangia bacterium]|nr:T6SS amidase immunity protein Tai4 family protein [Polyangia bacterium]